MLPPPRVLDECPALVVGRHSGDGDGSLVHDGLVPADLSVGLLVELGEVELGPDGLGVFAERDALLDLLLLGLLLLPLLLVALKLPLALLLLALLAMGQCDAPSINRQNPRGSRGTCVDRIHR